MIYVGGRIGYFSGNILGVREDAQALRPTIFTSVPRLLYRLYDATYERVGKSPLKRFLLRRALKEKNRKVDK